MHFSEQEPIFYINNIRRITINNKNPSNNTSIVCTEMHTYIFKNGVFESTPTEYTCSADLKEKAKDDFEDWDLGEMAEKAAASSAN